MEETLEMATKVAASQNWQEEIQQKWHMWHGSMVATGEKWLDHAASIELTNPSPKYVSWTEELDDFKSFVSLPTLDRYSDAMVAAFHDGVQGAGHQGIRQQSGAGVSEHHQHRRQRQAGADPARARSATDSRRSARRFIPRARAGAFWRVFSSWLSLKPRSF